MYNLAIALGIATALFATGWGVAGTWVAGFVPAVLAMVVTYILLARRTGKQLQVLMGRAVKEFEQGRVDNGRRVLSEGFKLARWQFLVGPQLHGQLGALDYMQRRWKAARLHLGKSWSRNWMAQAMLAALDHREGKGPKALERMEKIRGSGKKDPVYWGLYAYIALENGQRDKALGILNDALAKHENSQALRGMANAVRNKRKVKMKGFAPGWYQFFPEQMPRSAMQSAAMNRPGYHPPQPRR